MTLEEVFAEWHKDSKIDSAALDSEALKIPSLHQKYLEIFSKENLRLRKLRGEFKQCELAKFEYYSGKMDEAELEDRGWKQFNHRLLKTDIPRYLEGDKDLIDLALKVGIQNEKVDALKSILSNVNNRSFNISNAVKWNIFINGGN